MNQIIKDHHEKLSYTTAIQDSINTISKTTSDLILSNSKDEIQNLLELLSIERGNASASLNSLAKLSGPGEMQVLIANLSRTGSTYLSYQDQIITLALSGKKDEAGNLRIEKGAIYQKDLFTAIGQMTTFQTQKLVTAANMSSEVYQKTLLVTISLAIFVLILITSIMYWIMRTISTRLHSVSHFMTRFANGTANPSSRLAEGPEDEIGGVSRAFNMMAQSLEDKKESEWVYNKSIQEQSWLKENLARISTKSQGISNPKQLAEAFITDITPLVGANCGVFYEVIESDSEDQRYLKLLSSYAYDEALDLSKSIRFGDGLVGQSALNKQVMLIDNVPPHFLPIQSALGKADPLQIIILPLLFEQHTVAVIELASFKKINPIQQALLEQLADHIGIILDSLHRQRKIEQLLLASQTLAEELQSQSEELRKQQDELARANAELEEQNNLYYLKNQEVESTKAELEQRATQLITSSKYKTEFLANMSHELRTPLNSMLILAKLLADNGTGNLNAKQTEFAKTIFSAGEALLDLINEILDLSKVESGRMDVLPSDIPLVDILSFINRSFMPLAQQKGLYFQVNIDPTLPEFIYTDGQRLHQILQNLLSNAFKFTSVGGVTVDILPVAKHIVRHDSEILLGSGQIISFQVKDTGIGISKDKHELIFEAFLQADGKTSRKYGGTGLGLSICRELALLLGGVIRIESEINEGSTFTLFLPETYVAKENPEPPQLELPKLKKSTAYKEVSTAADHSENKSSEKSPTDDIVLFDRRTPIVETINGKIIEFPVTTGNIFEGSKILIVDDDIRNVFALSSVLENYKIQVVVAENGREGVETLESTPDIDLVLMDIMMPEMDGYEAMQMIRSMPKHHNLPIIALTAKAMKDDREKCIEAGASDYITKPVNINQLISLLQVWLFK